VETLLVLERSKCPDTMKTTEKMNATVVSWYNENKKAYASVCFCEY